MKEFGHMTMKDHHRPSGKVLIVMEIDARESEVEDEVIVSRPGSCAGLALRVAHG
jgi:hypothetical protein